MSTQVYNDSIGQRIQRRRKELGMSIKELSQKVNVSESTLRDWENGRKIQGEPYVDLAMALRMPVLSLLTEQKVRIKEIEQEINKLYESVENIEKMIIPYI